MATPEFILSLREKVGHEMLWLTGVTAVILRPSAEQGAADEVLLVRRSDNAEWTPVTGIIDPGESAGETARREVFEETGVVASIDRLVLVQTLPPMTYPNGDRSQYLDHVFRGSHVSGEAVVGDDESTEVGWFGLDMLPPMAETQLTRIARAVENRPEAYFD